MTPQEQQTKARFFGMHIGCKVESQFGEIAELLSAGVDGVALHDEDGLFHLKWGGNTVFKLVLRPLSSITDEELEVVYDLTYKGIEYAVKSKAYLLPNLKKSFAGGRRIFQIDVADYLRSIGICIPFMGIDPVAAGWAVLEK